MISRHSAISIFSFLALTASVTACGVEMKDGEDEDSVASAAGKRKGGGGSPEQPVDAGVPTPPPLPPTLLRGDYTLPLPAEPTYVEPQELDCFSENAIWNRLAFFPVTQPELDRLGALQIRYYSMSLGMQGIEDQGGGIGNRFVPLAGAPLGLVHAGGLLQKLDFFGEALPGNAKPYHVTIERTAGTLSGQYEYASVIQPEKISPITSCAPKSISHMNAEMAFNTIGLSMATGVACNVTSGARAGSNVMIHPMVGQDVVRVGGTYLSYYQGELDGSWNEQLRTVDSVLYRPSRDLTSATLSYTPAMGVSPNFDFHGVSPTGDALRIQAAKTSATGYDWSTTLGDGTTLEGCRWVLSPSAIRKFEAERLVHVGLPRAKVDIVTQ